MTVEVFVQKLEDELDKIYDLGYVRYVEPTDTLIVAFEYFDRQLYYVKKIGYFKTKELELIEDHIEEFANSLLNEYREELRRYLPTR